jgi:hypothetical protein
MSSLKIANNSAAALRPWYDMIQRRLIELQRLTTKRAQSMLAAMYLGPLVLAFIDPRHLLTPAYHASRIGG